jgi:hypothetical protein
MSGKAIWCKTFGNRRRPGLEFSDRISELGAGRLGLMHKGKLTVS